MALASISLNNGATVQGRLLARNAAVTPDQQRDQRARRARTSTTPPPGRRRRSGGSGGTWRQRGTGGTPASPPPGSETTVPTRNGTITWKRETPRGELGQPACTAGFTRHRSAVARSRRSSTASTAASSRAPRKSPFRLFVRGLPGKHKVTARVTFKDATPTKTLSLDYRACAAVALRPTHGPSRFTG